MPKTKEIHLEFGSSSLICNLQKGAAITHLSLGETDTVSVISPQENYHFESSLLFPFPNRLANGKFNFEGHTYQFDHNDFGLPNALHGIVHNMEFNLIDQGKNDNKAWLTAGLDYQGILVAFPFLFQLNVTYTLSDVSMDIEVQVKNTGRSKLPFGFGWHPYFNLPEGVKNSALKIPKSTEIEVDERMIPTGNKKPSLDFEDYRSLTGVSLDTCFEVSEKKENSTIIALNERMKLEISQDSQFPYIQIFTPEDGLTIAVEPMTCGIDALNNESGLQVLLPDQTITLGCGVRLSQ